MVWRGMPVRSPSRGSGDSPVDGMLAEVESRVSSPVLVGRSGQLSALDTALAEAVRGSPSAVMVGGEAGVGKSRLVREFAERSKIRIDTRKWLMSKLARVTYGDHNHTEITGQNGGPVEFSNLQDEEKKRKLEEIFELAQKRNGAEKIGQ